MEYIAKNIEQVKKNIEAAALKSGRTASDITLVAVTKTHGIDMINKAVDAGMTQLGENKVQELLSKYEFIENVDWHLIGHLQTNKVKYIIDKVSLIHSVESIKLAAEIDKRAKEHGRIMNVLVEINIGNEHSKYGINIDEAKSFINEAKNYENIKIKGLMCIAPFVDEKEENRECFKKMKQKFDEIKALNIPNVSMELLSMGMSIDYEVAIEEGSNMVRVGTSIFGSRVYA